MHICLVCHVPIPKSSNLCDECDMFGYLGGLVVAGAITDWPMNWPQPMMARCKYDGPGWECELAVLLLSKGVTYGDPGEESTWDRFSGSKFARYAVLHELRGILAQLEGTDTAA